MQELEKKLNYTFRNQELLREALNHSSYANEHRSQGLGSNERLEFLGDSVLNLAVSSLLYQRLGSLPEGDLSRVRANMVKQDTLHSLAQDLRVAEVLRLGEGESRSGGVDSKRLAADHPELFAQYKRDDAKYRKFLIKEV